MPQAFSEFSVENVEVKSISTTQTNISVYAYTSTFQYVIGVQAIGFI